MTNEYLLITLTLIGGVALGVIFFGGLWITVKKGLTSSKPALWFMLSFLLRMAVALAGFYYISSGDLKRLLSCLIGFMIARILVKKWTGKNPLHPTKKMEAGYET